MLAESQTRDPSVLILTRAEDATADVVEKELDELGVSWVRYDIAAFPLKSGLTARFGKAPQATLCVGDTEVDLSTVTAIYHRRPGAVMPPESLEAGAAAFVAAEAQAGLVGVLLSLDCLWVNHPAAAMTASYKPFYLAEASRRGLTVPNSVITNIPSRALGFLNAAPGKVAYKSLGHDFLADKYKHLGVPTKIVERGEIDESVAVTATMFQEFVNKDHDVRVTIVGSSTIGVAIHAHSHETHVDWRVDYGSLTYEAVELPVHVRESLLKLMASLGLNFATIDFSVDVRGRWFFLDLNPNGQWLWLTQYLDLPIAKRLGELLSSGSRSY